MKIDPEFKQLMPPLTTEEFNQLEENIAKEGCRDALITWNGILLDGHNRFNICTRKGIGYSTVEIDLPDRDAAIEWIINNQLGRRNITNEQRSYLIGLQYKQEKKQVTNPYGVKGKDVEQNVPQFSTAAKIAAQHGISHMAVKRNEKFTDGVDAVGRIAPEVKHEILQGKSDLTKSEVITFASQPPEVIATKIEQIKKPHVANNSGNNEWYTPPKYIEIARLVMGSIDCDPASSYIANQTVKASTYYTVEEDGLTKDWIGNVWLNPPYAQPLMSQFADKLIEQMDKGNIKQACVLVNNATETNWFQTLAQRAAAIWFIKGRIRYLDMTGNVANTPLQGQCILYYGEKVDKFEAGCPGLMCRCLYGR